MKKYNKIAVIYGSDSSESEISCRSGEYVASRIDDSLYEVYEIFASYGHWSLVSYRKKNAIRVEFIKEARPEINKTDFSVSIYGEIVKFDYAYIMQHGRPGENGLLQGYFEMLNIPYSSCNSFVSALTFDKYACKSYLKPLSKVNLAKDCFIRKGDDLSSFIKNEVSKLKFPVFVKPTNAGSSFGMSKVKEEKDLEKAIKFAFTEGDTVIVEEGIMGREITCATYQSRGEIKTLPLIEIKTENEYFDYDAKYNGKSEEICPAIVSETIADEIRKCSKEIYRYLDCSGLVRIDYISSDAGLYFLEINTIPGMTSASLVPKMIKAAGINITDFLTDIIESK